MNEATLHVLKIEGRLTIFDEKSQKDGNDKLLCILVKEGKLIKS